MTNVFFSVPFIAGKQRPRFVNGRAHKTDTERIREEAIALSFEEAGGACAPPGVPVMVSIQAHKSRKGHDGEPFTGKPDADNIVKLVLDALNGKAWHDDSQVTSINVNKLAYAAYDRISVGIVWRD